MAGWRADLNGKKRRIWGRALGKGGSEDGDGSAGEQTGRNFKDQNPKSKENSNSNPQDGFPVAPGVPQFGRENFPPMDGYGKEPEL
jgi:hypothetical protein